MNGHAKVVKLLLGKAGLHVNQADHQGRTPLSAAAKNGQFEVAELLLANAILDYCHWQQLLCGAEASTPNWSRRLCSTVNVVPQASTLPGVNTWIQ